MMKIKNFSQIQNIKTKLTFFKCYYVDLLSIGKTLPKWLETKYKNGVAHIITFGKLKARMVLRDVGRVLGLSYGHVDRICKMVPFDPSRPLTLQESIDREPRFKEEVKNSKL